VQAQRLWGVDEQTCANVLKFLVEVRFLHETADGRFARLTEGVVSLPPVWPRRDPIRSPRRRRHATYHPPHDAHRPN
jgi:hypothetical protein